MSCTVTKSGFFCTEWSSDLIFESHTSPVGNPPGKSGIPLVDAFHQCIRRNERAVPRGDSEVKHMSLQLGSVRLEIFIVCPKHTALLAQSMFN